MLSLDVGAQSLIHLICPPQTPARKSVKDEVTLLNCTVGLCVLTFRGLRRG